MEVVKAGVGRRERECERAVLVYRQQFLLMPDAGGEHRAQHEIRGHGMRGWLRRFESEAQHRRHVRCERLSGQRHQPDRSRLPLHHGRIGRHVRRHASAQAVAQAFRARPDLVKSEKKDQGSDLVRTYLLIDAALA